MLKQPEKYSIHVSGPAAFFGLTFYRLEIIYYVKYAGCMLVSVGGLRERSRQSVNGTV